MRTTGHGGPLGAPAAPHVPRAGLAEYGCTALPCHGHGGIALAGGWVGGWVQLAARGMRWSAKTPHSTPLI